MKFYVSALVGIIKVTSLLSYPAHSLVTMSTELFQFTQFDSNINVFSLMSLVVEGFQKQTLPICDYKFLRVTSQ